MLSSIQKYHLFLGSNIFKAIGFKKLFVIDHLLPIANKKIFVYFYNHHDNKIVAVQVRIKHTKKVISRESVMWADERRSHKVYIDGEINEVFPHYYIDIPTQSKVGFGEVEVDVTTTKDLYTPSSCIVIETVNKVPIYYTLLLGVDDVIVSLGEKLRETEGV